MITIIERPRVPTVGRVWPLTRPGDTSLGVRRHLFERILRPRRANWRDRLRSSIREALFPSPANRPNPRGKTLRDLRALDYLDALVTIWYGLWEWPKSLWKSS
jgi:hypothetical protein